VDALLIVEPQRRKLLLLLASGALLELAQALAHREGRAGTDRALVVDRGAVVAQVDEALGAPATENIRRRESDTSKTAQKAGEVKVKVNLNHYQS
jgi:hypothetical protein